MDLIISEPTKAYIRNASESDLSILRKELSYKNTSAFFQAQKIKNNKWWQRKDPDGWEKALKDAQSNINNQLIFKDSGGLYIRPGSISYIENLVHINSITNNIEYPKPKVVPWARTLPFSLYEYQKRSVESLIKAKHGAVSLCTGAGKSACILSLYRETGLLTAVIAPSKGIFTELLEKFKHHFGSGAVGAFGDGKKVLGKKITVCIGDSLCNVKKGSKEWDFFSKMQTIIVDESHSWASNTLEIVCHDLFSLSPYRFFLSATQVRGDGSLPLLQSIIGRITHSLSTKEAVEGGYICPHNYKIIEIEGDQKGGSKDPLEVKRQLFLRNSKIAEFSARLSNVVGEKGDQVLILVEELSQISAIIKLLRVPFGYAHSESNKDKLADLGLEKVNVSDQIEKFNKNEIKVLIGTSCLHVGVNIYSMRHTINWIGGSSEIKTRQAAVGRSIRLGEANPYRHACAKKDIVTIYDFDIKNNKILERHLKERLFFYEDSGEGLVTRIRI